LLIYRKVKTLQGFTGSFLINMCMKKQPLASKTVYMELKSNVAPVHHLASLPRRGEYKITYEYYSAAPYRVKKVLETHGNGIAAKINRDQTTDL